QSGQPQVTFETMEERQQRRDQQSQQQQSEGAASMSSDNEQATLETEQQSADMTAEGAQMTVGDITNMEVVTADGDNLGNPDAVIEMNGEHMLIVSSGGFLGLGDTQVPVELSTVSFQNGQIVLQQLTEQQIENANDFEYDSEMALSEDAPVEIMN
uniref:PRC-barrel domain-containing protein n=1 Tax=Palleronia sp. TaxID=1940284 RepID=UPI0035C84ABD